MAHKRFSRVVAVAWIALAGILQTTYAGVLLHDEGFESDTGGWNSYNSTITRVGSGTNGIASAAGSYHLEITDPADPADYSGAYSFLGGSRTDLGVDWSSSLDVYIDLDDPRITAGTYGFDLSQAMYNTGGSHEQDNIFHVGAVDSGGADVVLLNASHNSEFGVTPGKLASSSQPYGSAEAPGEFTTSGWYTFNFGFAPSTTKPGFAEVAFSVLDSDDNEFWSASWTTEGVSLGVAGGNGYMWFTFADADVLAIDNAQVTSTAVIPEPCTLAIWAGLGGLGLAVGRRRRRKA